jgi:hypothetical protein
LLEAETEISYWANVRNWHLQNEYDLFECVKKIVLELVKDKKLFDWMKYHNAKYELKDGSFNFSTPPVTGVPYGDYAVDFEYDPTNIFYNSVAANNLILGQTNDMEDIFDLCDKIKSKGHLYHNLALKHYAIQLHNFLSQYYSFARSFKVLKDYMKSFKDYKPDIIWSTRTDVFHNINEYDISDKFNLLQDQLNRLHTERITNKRAILSNQVLIDRNQPYVCDFSLFSTVKMLDNILNLDKQTCEDIIFNAMTRNKIDLIKTKDAKSATQHALWSAIFNA